jgi:hypothetical protein
MGPIKAASSFQLLGSRRNAEAEDKSTSIVTHFPTQIKCAILTLGQIVATFAFVKVADTGHFALDQHRRSASRFSDGEVAEWSKAPVSKTGMFERASRVRIPPSPQ